MTKHIESSKDDTLYAAATESLVADATANSTFEKMIHVAFSHSTVDTFKKEVRDTEVQIKKDFAIKSMPSPWRSAKSVVISALTLGIRLMDNNGVFYGKTALQNLIKSAKENDKPEPDITADEWVTAITSKMTKVPADIQQKVWDGVAEFINAH